MSCDKCGAAVPLEYMVRDVPNQPGIYNCKDCHADSYEGMIYRPVMPFNGQKNKGGQIVARLIKWAFGLAY